MKTAKIDWYRNVDLNAALPFTTSGGGFVAPDYKGPARILENQTRGFNGFTTWAEIVRIGVGLFCSLSPPRSFALPGINLVTDKGIGVVGEEVT